MDKHIATITLLDQKAYQVTFIDRKVELLNSIPVGFYIKARLVDGTFIEIPYSSILNIEYK